MGAIQNDRIPKIIGRDPGVGTDGWIGRIGKWFGVVWEGGW